MAYEVSMVLSLSFILLNSTTNSEGFFSVFSLEMKINILSMFGFFVFYFFFIILFYSFWRYTSLATEEKLDSLFWLFITYLRVLFIYLVVFIQLGIFCVVSFGLLLFLPPINLKHGMRVFHVISFSTLFHSKF